MKSVRVGSSGDCAAGLDCFPIQARNPAKRSWIGDGKVFLATLNNGEQRHVMKVMYRRRSGQGTALMDCVTGTMYKDGRCLTSDVLTIVSVDETDHSNGLLSKKGPDWGEFGRSA